MHVAVFGGVHSRCIVSHAPVARDASPIASASSVLVQPAHVHTDDALHRCVRCVDVEQFASTGSQFFPASSLVWVHLSD